MKIELVRFNGKVFDSVEVSDQPQDLICFCDKIWKKGKGQVWQEVRSTFLPLPPMGATYGDHQAAAAPQTPPVRGSVFG